MNSKSFKKAEKAKIILKKNSSGKLDSYEENGQAILGVAEWWKQTFGGGGWYRHLFNGLTLVINTAEAMSIT